MRRCRADDEWQLSYRRADASRATGQTDRPATKRVKSNRPHAWDSVQNQDYRRAGDAVKMITVPRYTDYCPIATGVDVLGDRWTPLVIRELTVGVQPASTRSTAGIPRISRTLLAQRLRTARAPWASSTPPGSGDAAARAATS